MPRWTSCYIDKRAISNKGQWGEYICEKCGKHFLARMCAKKRVKHIFCSTRCKKDSQVKTDRPKIENKIFKTIYDKYYNKVKTICFQLCEDSYDRAFLEDYMQYGFVELWYIYNRNKFDCSEKYIRKSIKNAIIGNMRYKWKENRKIKEGIACKTLEDFNRLLYKDCGDIYDYNN